MNNILSNYTLTEKIGKGDGSILYRGHKEDDARSVLLQIFGKAQAFPSDIARFRHEYEKVLHLTDDCVIRTHEMFEHDGDMVLVLEDFDGRPVKDLVTPGGIGIERFLDLSVKISRAIGEIHRHQIIHQAITPRNILTDAGCGKVKITGFGASRLITHIHEDLYDPWVIDEILPYISPEQTGRMNCSVDHRTDLYSAGIVFYALLTGSPPFTSSDPTEIIHSHIARMPAALDKRRAAIPKVLSDIILKLLSKPVEERYCNAFGLMHDLIECRRRLADTGKIEAFPLGQKDISTVFHIPEKVFGRKTETEILMDSFNRARNGGNELVLVSGPPGIGKSALVREIRKPVTIQKGYFLTGKYDQYKRDIPYSAITEAFSGFVRQILFESEDRIRIWRHEIQKAVGVNGRIVTDLIPDIELIIGSPPAAPVLGLEETQNRFRHVFKNFVNICGQREHPLVLFLDDLQWADAASLGFIRMLAVDPEIRFLQIVGAFRDKEIGPSHPLPITIEEIRKNGGHVHILTLPPLGIESINQLLTDLLRCDKSRAAPLGEMIQRKTGGNPFFIRQLLKTLYDGQVFEPDPHSGWTWDMDKVAAFHVTDNVVELVAEGKKGLPKETRDALTLCACLGSRFNPVTASAVSGASVEKTVADLGLALDSGLIDFVEDSGVFCHDRVREAAYSLLTKDARTRMHYFIGRYLLEAVGEANLKDEVIDIVNHLNLARSLVTDAKEQHRLARLNRMAGEKALASAAYQSAFYYFTTGIELCGECWEEDDELALALYSGAAETAYLSTHYDDARQLTESILAHARSHSERVKAYIIRLHTLMAENRLFAVVDTGLSVLKTLGVKFPKNPRIPHIVAALLQTKISLRGKKINSFLDHPLMEDPLEKSKVEVMATICSTAYWTVPNLMLLIILKLMRMFVQYGNTGYSPYIYGGYGFILCGLGEIDAGYGYGKMALSLIEQMDEKKYKACTYMVVNTFVRHWKEHAGNEIPQLLEAYRSGLEYGDIEFAAHSMMVRAYTLYFVGTPLADLESELCRTREAIGQLGQTTDLHMVQIDHQAVLNLTGKNGRSGHLKGESYDEDKMLPVHRAANDRTCLFHLYYNKLILHYLFHDYAGAYHAAEEAGRVSDAALGSLCYPVFIFYDSLTRIGIFSQKGPLEKRLLLRRVAVNQRKMKKWARHAPENFRHKYYLVAAELGRIRGRYRKAMAAYDTSIRGAVENGYIQEAAMACECAARFYRENGFDDIAATYMTRARQSYMRWGAEAKVRDLEENEWALLGISARAAEASSKTVRGTEPVDAGGAAGKVDIAAIMKMSQAISGEIILEKLLVKMMQLIIELSGAEKGLLILNRDDRLIIEARGSVNEEAVAVPRGLPVEESDALCPGIVSYVRRTGETLVLDDAMAEGRFAADPYIQKNQARSVLCLPLIRQQRVIGIIYLENNLTPNAFRSERLDMVQLLSTQAAISLENAVLVDDIVAAEREAKEQRERYRLLVETMNDGLGVIDAAGRFKYVNDALCRMSGYPEKEIIGRALVDFLDAPNRKIFKAQFSRRPEAEQGVYELTWKGRDGRLLSTIVSPQPLFDAEGNFDGSLAIVTDITELKKAQKEKEIMQAQLLQSQKMEAVGKLAGGVAHDFNNYLTAIMGSAEILMHKMDKADQRVRHLNEILKAAERSAMLTHQLLAFSRKQMLETSFANFNEVVARMERLLRRIIGEDIAFNTVLDPDLKMIKADWGQMEQVIMNLSVNARDAMPEGGVLTIKTENVVIDEWYCHQISYARPGEFICLTIEDTGSGIEPELLENIFEPFFTTKATGQGTGLGLSVVFGVIKQHEGWINVYSEPGKGTQFKVYLPAADKGSDDAYAVPAAAQQDISPDYKGNGESILVIEDQKEVRRFITDALVMNGYQVIGAGSISEARSRVQRRSGPIHLLFSDVVLPDGSGIDFAEQIVQQIPEMRVLISSGYTKIGSYGGATGNGRFHFLQKPYTLEKLLRMVFTALQES